MSGDDHDRDNDDVNQTTSEVKNAFELAYKDMAGNSTRSLIVCADTPEDKRSWLKDIRTIIKNYQREEYQANKSKLIRGL